MLVEFRVANYRSIAETQTLSLVASSDDTHQKTHCIASGITAAPHLLRSAVIYGPNAGGKSTLISALGFMRYLVETSATLIREGQVLNTMPFRFEQSFKNKSTEFEVTFIEENIRYQYSFAFTTTQITHERLFAYIGKKPQRWFEREYDSKKNQYKWYFSSYFSASSGQRLLWKKSTRNNALFLSTAINLNSEQLRPVFHWFINKLAIIQNGAALVPDMTVNYINKGTAEKAKVLQLLQAADFRINDIKIEKRKGQTLGIHINQGKAPIQTVQETDIPIISFLHQATETKQTAELLLAEESTGTQRWFNFAGVILEILQHNCVLVVNELDSSLHTLLAQFFVKLFHTSNHKAQLIFSTHNTSLLDKELFRRDQIWFIEKNNQEASQLYPLTDFSPRKDEALEKGYLTGRYGALPFFGEINF